MGMDRDRRFTDGEGGGLRDRPRERFSLAELTEASGVSVRTVRYYIAEGLLPPPVGSGPKAYYTRDHLDRLTLIGRMRANYLPLKEIRRRLEEMTPEEVRREAAEPGDGVGEATRTTRTSSPPQGGRGRDEAGASVGWPKFRVLEEAGNETTAARPAAATPPAAAFASPWDEEPGLFYLAADDFDADAAADAAFDVDESPAGEEAATWRRVRIGPEAELMVSERLYQRRREAVEQLRKLGRLLFG